MFWGSHHAMPYRCADYITHTACDWTADLSHWLSHCSFIVGRGRLYFVPVTNTIEERRF